MSGSEVYRKRWTVQARVPQDGRKYARESDPLYEYDVLVEINVEAIAHRVARQAARNRTGRAKLFAGVAAARVSGHPREVSGVA